MGRGALVSQSSANQHEGRCGCRTIAVWAELRVQNAGAAQTRVQGLGAPQA